VDGSFKPAISQWRPLAIKIQYPAQSDAQPRQLAPCSVRAGSRARAPSHLDRQGLIRAGGVDRFKQFRVIPLIFGLPDTVKSESRVPLVTAGVVDLHTFQNAGPKSRILNALQIVAILSRPFLPMPSLRCWHRNRRNCVDAPNVSRSDIACLSISEHRS
jgi:hypothetical protein